MLTLPPIVTDYTNPSNFCQVFSGLFTEPFNCRFLIAFIQKVAIRRSLLQRKGWDLEIPPTGKLNDSGAIY